MSERRSRLLFVLTVLVLITSLLMACAPAPTPTPRPTPTSPPAATPTPVPPTPTPAPPTTFRIAVGIDPDTLDPAGMTTTTVANMVDYIVETLVLDREGKIVPNLAESWTISPDGLEYTFKLRKGVKFHDGTPFDATAVKATLERLLDKDVRVPIRFVYTPIEKIEVVDPLTIKLTLSHPSAPMLHALSFTTSAIVSPKSIEKGTDAYKRLDKPIGTGPYVFKERVKGERIVVTKFKDYWGKKPYYDTVIFRIVPEAATRESLLLAGQVDLIILPPISDIPALQKNPNVKVLLAPSDRSIFIAMNNLKEPLTDKRVRQALNYAVNKEEIIKSVLFGAADALDAPMSPALFGYCKVGKYEYNPDKAKELLKAAGIAPGTKIQFIAPTGRYVQDFQAAQAIAGYLREVGIDAPVSTMDWPSYVATISKPPEESTTQLHFLGWAPVYLDASFAMLQFLSTQAPPAGLESSFYKNPEVDELILAAERELDPEKRKEMYCEASKKIWEDAPWIFLWNQRFPIIYSAKVKNVSSLPNEMFYALYAEPAP